MFCGAEGVAGTAILATAAGCGVSAAADPLAVAASVVESASVVAAASADVSLALATAGELTEAGGLALSQPTVISAATDSVANATVFETGQITSDNPRQGCK